MQTHITPSATATARRTALNIAALITLVLSLGVTAASAQSAGAAELTSDPRSQSDDPVAGRQQELSAGVDFLSTSAYVWRGFVPGADRSLQTNGWMKFGQLTLSSWMNVESAHTKVSEHDLTIDYSAARGSVTWSAGYINYVFPGAASDSVSHEVYAGLSHSSFLNPTVRIYQDLGAGSGTYVSAGASHGFLLPWQSLLVTPSVTLGYNHRQWIDASTFSDLTVGLKGVWTSPIRRITVSPFVNYSKSLSSGLFTSRLFWGLGVSVI